MALRICLLTCALLLLSPGAHTWAQVVPSATALASPLRTESRVPDVAKFFRGFNVGLNYAGVHNSSVSWYSVASPALSFKFSNRYSADISSAIYFKHQELDYVQEEGEPGSSYQMVSEGEDVGDTLFAFHAAFQPRSYRVWP